MPQAVSLTTPYFTFIINIGDSKLSKISKHNIGKENQYIEIMMPNNNYSLIKSKIHIYHIEKEKYWAL